MPTSSSPVLVPLSERNAAYTTARWDIVEMIPRSARKILDVGCSNGAIGRALMSGEPGRSVCGIEFDADFAKEAARDLDYVVHGDLNVLDWQTALRDRQFDCIIFADVLEHLVDPQRCIRQARQHLLPGGSIVMSLPNIRHLSALRAIFLSGNFPQRDRGIFDRTHLRWFTIGDAKDMLAASGFKVNAMTQALRWGDTGGGRVNKLLNRLPDPLRRWAPIREFLTYQVCFRAELVA
jgi:SAM-dependent methyltransferase